MGMRRQQLIDLADAYAVKLTDRDAVRERLLREMLAAQEDGKFVGTAKRPFYLAKAMRRSDDPPLAVEAPPEERVAAPAPPTVDLNAGAAAPDHPQPSVERAKGKPKTPRGTAPNTMKRFALVKRARVLGIMDPHRMKLVELEVAIKEAESGN